jgi:hypothetical protein
VSDRTPWRGLERDRAGWDLPLRREAWLDALRRCRAMDADGRHELRRGAIERARRAWRDGLAGDDALRRLIVALTDGHPLRVPEGQQVAMPAGPHR